MNDRVARCPQCNQSCEAGPHRPFCSARCQQLDLARWLGGDYRIETEDGPSLLGPDEASPASSDLSSWL